MIKVEKREAFTSDGTSDEELKKFGKSVEKRCMSQILLYEGGIQEVEAQTGITKTENYLAVGMQVREYKKALKNLTVNKDLLSQEHPPAPDPKTGNSSMLRFTFSW